MALGFAVAGIPEAFGALEIIVSDRGQAFDLGLKFRCLLPLLPRAVLSQCLMLAIGAWFTLAAFLWYGESHPRALPAHDLPETGESDESDPSRDICPPP